MNTHTAYVLYSATRVLLAMWLANAVSRFINAHTEILAVSIEVHQWSQDDENNSEQRKSCTASWKKIIKGMGSFCDFAAFVLPPLNEKHVTAPQLLYLLARRKCPRKDHDLEAFDSQGCWPLIGQPITPSPHHFRMEHGGAAVACLDQVWDKEPCASPSGWSNLHGGFEYMYLKDSPLAYSFSLSSNI